MLYHWCKMAAITNYTGDEKQKSLAELFCSAKLTGAIHSQLIFLSVLNIFLSITAFLGNTLILVALHKESSLHPPSKLLFRSLAATDLCVGIIVQPLYVTRWISGMYEQWDTCRSTFTTFIITSRMLCLVSLLTLAAISVDRLLALLLGLRYRQVVTIKRTYVTVLAFWVSAFVGSEIFPWNELLSYWYSYIVGMLCVAASIYSYTRIFLRLRHHQTQVQDNVTGQPNQTIPLNIARYRKTAATALWLQLTLVVCYFPFIVVAPFAFREIRSSLSSPFYLALASTVTLFLFNSSVNPILYCWKIKELRQIVKEIVRQLFCSSS